MPLETGTWQINENGNVSQLVVTGVDVTGNVNGNLAGIPIFGSWDELSQKLTFMLGSPHLPGQAEKLYAGFLFTDSFRMPGINGATVFTLAGFVVTAASEDRPILGWYAQIGVA